MSPWETFRRVILSSRPISWINTAYPFAAGYLMVTRDFDWVFVAGVAFFLIPYNLVIYGINDVFDWVSDLNNPRKGGVEGDVIRDREQARKVHWWIIRLGTGSVVAFGFLLFALGDALANTVWVLVVFFAFAYSLPPLRFKERPFLDSFTSAMHFVGPLVYGIVLADGQPLSMQVWPVLLAFVLWAMASHAFGAVQDVRADRAGGIASIATAMGARRTVHFSIALYVASAAVLLLLGWPRLVVALLPLAYLGVALPYVTITDENCQEANGGWRLFLWLNQAVGAFVTIALIAVATGQL